MRIEGSGAMGRKAQRMHAAILDLLCVVSKKANAPKHNITHEKMEKSRCFPRREPPAR